jgi:hypothetical protein
MMAFVCFFYDGSPDREFDTLDGAQRAAAEHAGCPRYNKPFPNEDTYLYGPGDGTTTVMVRRKRH